jgi:hypothetical protein
LFSIANSFKTSDDTTNEPSFADILDTTILSILECIGQVKLNLQMFNPIIRDYFRALEQIISSEVEKLTDIDEEEPSHFVVFAQIARNVLNKWLTEKRHEIEPILRKRPINYDKLWSIYEKTEKDVASKARFEGLLRRLNPERLFGSK